MSTDGMGLWLRVAVAVGGLVPVSAGLAGVVLGSSILVDIDSSARASADGHFRYLSGLLLGIGLGFWSTIPTIERQTVRVRLLAAIVVVGGMGWLIGLTVNGQPSGTMLFALTMELGVRPLLCLWQSQVSRDAALMNSMSDVVPHRR